MMCTLHVGVGSVLAKVTDMTRHPWLMNLWLLSALLLVAACASGGGPVRVNQPLGATPPASSVQALFESGRDDEAASRAAAPAVSSEDVWYGAQSLLRMGQRAEAIQQFTRLRDTAASPAFRRAAEIGLARINEQPDAVGLAQAGAAEFPTEAHVQFEAGITLALQGDMAAAARAFDAAINASPMLAYAYYQAGIAYSRLDRADLTVSRFEAFVRLAPSAPERPQVEGILRTARGR